MNRILKQYGVPALLGATAAALFIQTEWALSSDYRYSPEADSFIREALVYGFLALWFALFVPRRMIGKSRPAAGLILVGFALAYTLLVFLLNNLWHMLSLFAMARDHGWTDIEWISCSFGQLRYDAAYHIGRGAFRYPAVFAASVLLIWLAYRFRARLFPEPPRHTGRQRA